MSRPAVFPYGIVLEERGVIDTFPAVEASFKIPGNDRISLFLLLDSGASLSALPRSDAAFLGVDVERGTLMHVSGVSGKPVKGWRHSMSIQLAGERIVLPVVFLDDAEAPRVLGRADVFSKFTIVFEERKNRSGFLEAGSVKAKSVGRLLDQIN